MATPDIPSAKWVGHPRSYTSGRKSGQPTVIFIHTTEGSEGPNSAEDGAAYDKSRTDGTSTHLFVDQNSIVQEVEFHDEAHAARTHGNDVGIQIEICGKTAQTAAQWADAASVATVDNVIRAGYEIRKLYGRSRFPLVNLTPAQLRAGGHGFAAHYDATLAWPEDNGTHDDPGPNFPWARMFAGIASLEEEDDMPSADEIATATVEKLLDRKVNIEVQSGKAANLQPLEGIWRYESSEHHEAIDTAAEAKSAAQSAKVSADAAAQAVDALDAKLTAKLDEIIASLATPPAA